MLADPARWPEWWPGLVEAAPSVRRALAPGAHWHLEGTNRPSLLRRPQLGDDDRKAELERMLGGQEFLAAVRG